MLHEEGASWASLLEKQVLVFMTRLSRPEDELHSVAISHFSFAGADPPGFLFGLL